MTRQEKIDRLLKLSEQIECNDLGELLVLAAQPDARTVFLGSVQYEALTLLSDLLHNPD